MGGEGRRPLMETRDDRAKTGWRKRSRLDFIERTKIEEEIDESMDILLKRILKLTYAATTFEQPLSSIRSKWTPLDNFRFLRKSNATPYFNANYANTFSLIDIPRTIPKTRFINSWIVRLRGGTYRNWNIYPFLRHGFLENRLSHGTRNPDSTGS